MQNDLIQEKVAAGNRSVTVIISADGSAPSIADAIRSCKNQTVSPTEILLVDGRSQDQIDQIGTSSLPGVKVVRPRKAGPVTAQNLDPEIISSEFMVFVGAGEQLTPCAIEAGLHCFDGNSDAWLVVGAHQVVNAAGHPASPVWQERVDSAFCTGSTISVQAAVMYRTNRWHTIYPIDAHPKDRDGSNFYARCAGHITTHDTCVAEYRYDRKLLLARSNIGSAVSDGQPRSADTVLSASHGLLFQHNAPQMFAIAAKDIIRNGWSWESAKIVLRTAKMAPLKLLSTITSRGLTAVMQCLPRPIGVLFGERLWSPPLGKVRFGDFDRTKPINADYGFDRGTPIDRYYIECALKEHCDLVRGRVLEVGERYYTNWYGAERVKTSDVLDINPLNSAATIICDLGVLGTLPENAFDCIILTQTLQLIYNFNNAIENLYRALAPGGDLLITAPGISPIGPDETTYWHWAFTELSLKTILSEHFGENNVKARSEGNVFAAICFLTGISLPEIDVKKLSYNDKSYPVVVFASAHKPH